MHNTAFFPLRQRQENQTLLLQTIISGTFSRTRQKQHWQE